MPERLTSYQQRADELAAKRQIAHDKAGQIISQISERDSGDRDRLTAMMTGSTRAEAAALRAATEGAAAGENTPVNLDDIS